MASKQTIISPYVNINEINPALDHYKIRVRVIKLWKAFKSLQMVLVDDEGTRIHASIEDALVKKFHNQINIGDSKIIDTFSLVDYDDVVGQIAGVGSLDNIKTKGKDNVKITFDLQDLSGDRLSCTIWGDLARTFEASIKEHKDSVVVCVIRFACLKEWKGNYSVSNAFNTTDIHLNPSIPAVEKFRQMMPNTSVVELVHNEENIQPKVRTCVTIGTICSVETVPKWYYIACKECRKKVQPYPLESDKGKKRLYSCGVCDDDVKEVDYKYKLILHVSYGNSPKIKLLFFYGLAQLFVGKKADELVSQIAESDKASYVVAKFWEKKDMVNQFVKETYRKANDNYQELESDEQILELTSEESTSLSSKRELSGINEEVVQGHSMTTRKRIKIEKQT
ncbi:PREDICTED: uncharacterized protein LOC104773359 [Camelina sativa]|uniref:Uncharacterized protein LOC104773359 n=1 Tax=Camelina sativa TaxID=90675 RepID=A0ABM1RGP3_CAMSA|nr:PREDICTED: uncharacterized protein LOC104773359 [Camelina sativa]